MLYSPKPQLFHSQRNQLANHKESDYPQKLAIKTHGQWNVLTFDVQFKIDVNFNILNVISLFPFVAV